MGNKKPRPRQQSMFQGEERVGGIRWSGGIIGVGIIPPIKIGPKQGLIDTEEFDLVIGGDGMGQGIGSVIAVLFKYLPVWNECWGQGI